MKLIIVLLVLANAMNGFAQAEPFVDCAPDASAFDDRAYWTSARIRAARAFPIPVLGDAEVAALTHRSLLSANGARLFLSGSAAVTTPASGAPQSANVLLTPHSLVGKLLFRDINGQDSYCTAQLVQNDAMILTAAHCVRDEISGKFHDSFAFIAGYDDSLDRRAKVEHIGTWSNFRKPNYDIDYAFGSLKSPLGGHLQLEARLPSKRWISVGYPKDIQGGLVQQKVDGGGTPVGGNLVEMPNNEMNGGASGGGLIAKMKGKDTAIGVNSYRNGANMYSPFFDAAIWDVYRYVKAGCKKKAVP